MKTRCGRLLSGRNAQDAVARITESNAISSPDNCRSAFRSISSPHRFELVFTSAGIVPKDNMSYHRKTFRKLHSKLEWHEPKLFPRLRNAFRAHDTYWYQLSRSVVETGGEGVGHEGHLLIRNTNGPQGMDAKRCTICGKPRSRSERQLFDAPNGFGVCKACHEWVTIIVTRYHSELALFAATKLQFASLQEAQDVAQDAITTYLERLHDPDRLPVITRTDERLAKTLFSIVRNKCLNLNRNLKRRRTGNSYTEDTTDYRCPHRHNERERPDRIAEARESTEIVQDAINQLPEELRDLVVLRYFNRLSILEIADVVEECENTLKTKLRRARRLLRDKLEMPGKEWC